MDRTFSNDSLSRKLGMTSATYSSFEHLAKRTFVVMTPISRAAAAGVSHTSAATMHCDSSKTMLNHRHSKRCKIALFNTQADGGSVRRQDGWTERSAHASRHETEP